MSRWLLRSLALVIAGVLAWTLWCLRDRSPGYYVDIDLPPAEPAPLKVGFGRESITPAIGEGHPTVWMAGFANGRAATGVHDDLWAVAIVLDDGRSRIGLVALDAIGVFHDDVIAIRRRLKQAWGIHYAIVCATHNHSTPDLMGIWGPGVFRSGVDPSYREKVIDASVRALGRAVEDLQPAALSTFEIPTPPTGLVSDTRKPEVFDSDLRLMLFTHASNQGVLGSVVGWGNHPETPWSRNTEITADFPGALREALEDGIVQDGKIVVPGLGGTHVFVNGAVGGLMTTHPTTVVEDPWLGRELREPSHEKSRAVGRRLAGRILDDISRRGVAGASRVSMGIRARTFELPVRNPIFLLAPVLGMMDRGHVRWGYLRTEMAALSIGEASVLCIPGEIYPEIVNGGVIRAPGGDFDVEPVEVPPLRSRMPGRVRFVAGLANDEIGYIIPKSEWDRRPPYLFGSARPVYGEVNSLGPDTAPLLHAEALRLLEALGAGAPVVPPPPVPARVIPIRAR